MDESEEPTVGSEKSRNLWLNASRDHQSQRRRPGSIRIYASMPTLCSTEDQLYLVSDLERVPMPLLYQGKSVMPCHRRAGASIVSKSASSYFCSATTGSDHSGENSCTSENSALHSKHGTFNPNARPFHSHIGDNGFADQAPKILARQYQC